jgi:CO/xanthine dehydrogenase FAD-binding subunit
MRAALSTLEVIRPRTLKAALTAMAAKDGARPLPMAGCTDVFVNLNAGALENRRFLDLLPLASLRGIRVTRGRTMIGALTTFTAIRAHRVLARRHADLVAAAAEIGAVQNQNRATLGGNIANASPAGDSLPVLLAADALVHVRSLRGARAIPFEQLHTGYRQLATSSDELIMSVELPAPPRGRVPFFRKVGTRRAQSISKVVFAGSLVLGPGKRVTHVRLAWGSMAPVPVRARAAEARLLGERLTLAAAHAAADVLGEQLVPIDDIRSEREYRMAVARNVLMQFLRAAGAR